MDNKNTTSGKIPYEPKDTIVGNVADILAALSELKDILDRYGFVSVCDFYDLIGRTDLAVEFDKNNGGPVSFGWYDLSTAGLRIDCSGPFPMEFYLEMPSEIEAFDYERAQKNKKSEAKEKNCKLKIKDHRYPKMVQVKELDKGDLFEWVDEPMMIVESGSGVRWCVNLERGYLIPISDDDTRFCGKICEESFVHPASGTFTIEK